MPRQERPACLGDVTCPHWRMIDGLPRGVVALQHGDNPEHARVFVAGDMPEGMCADGHDIVLERWVHDVMRQEGCAAR